MIRALFHRLAPYRPAVDWAVFLALIVGGVVFLNWLEQPLEPAPGSLFGPSVLVICVLRWLLAQDRVRRIVGRVNLETAGVWRTSRAERVQRLLLVLFAMALLPPLARMGWAHWQAGDLPRLVGAVAASLVLLAGIVRFVVRTWRTQVELRIDAEGVYAPAWREPVGWDAIDFVAHPRNGFELTLVLKDGRSRDLLLTPTGLSSDEALAALRAIRPDLRVQPWTSNGFVLPIHGATDVPSTAKITTYG
ncbi:hypothetical protein [Caulobacter sp.]|uniref:hypothetical protein n=1 Tax=Caulobacter sp. TaxID=78 RepID=UPI001B05336A|nr:hypothetical protein [Caulobacter sp.]MBO9543836.1 hypothetical protein [Caulobacter sp.]